MKGRLTEVSGKTLASVLGLTDRWVRNLEKQGVFSRVGRGQYDLTSCVPAYIEWRVKAEAAKAAQPSGDRVRDARAAEIERRMAREDRDIIALDEAMAAFEDATGAFVQTLSGLPARITRNQGERRRIEVICDGERQRLTTRFEEVSTSLRTGRAIADPGTEDDA